MAVDPEVFKQVLARWPSGVTVVTTAADGVLYGMTASSFSSVSLNPPLVLVCIAQDASSHDRIVRSGVFAVNILSTGQVDLGKRFAGIGTGRDDRFAGLDVITASTGAPVLPEALAWIDCRLHRAYEGGDHTIFVGQVEAGGVADGGAPLLYHARSWGKFLAVPPDEALLRESSATALPPDRRDAHVRELVGAGLRAFHLGPAYPGLTVPQVPDGVTLSATAVDADALRHAKSAGADEVDVEVTVDGAAAAKAVLGAASDSRFLNVRALVTDGLGAQPGPLAEAIATVVDAGATEVCLADEAGWAHPYGIRDLVAGLGQAGRMAPLRLRLDDRCGLGLMNLLAALNSGVDRFDTALGGWGEGPDPVATEDAVHMLDAMGIGSGADAERLVAAARRLAEELGSPLPGRLHRRAPGVLRL